jgi:4-amino-4-deoxy-L-arabinose transferase-like glycosyltransferase
LLLWIATVGATLVARPPWPVDETRYLAVAWRMWILDDPIVPRLGADLYTDKPPLLFWLVHAGWSVLGVSETWARLLPPLFGLSSLFLTARLARRLWPGLPAAAELAPLLLAGALLWTFWSTLLMFDTLLVCFSLLALLAILAASRGAGAWAWAGLGFALGAGLLTKGPVLFLHVLPVALLAPAWARGRHRSGWRGYYAGLLFAVALGALLALAWVLAAAGGEDGLSGRSVVLDQSLKRILASAEHVHVEPWWYYLLTLPLLALPWTLWPRMWAALARLVRHEADDGVRLCTIWVVSGFFLASVIPAKQLHYLLPCFPGLALLASRALATAGSDAPARDAWLPALLPALAGGLLLAAPSAGAMGVPTDLPSWPGVTLLVAGLALALAPRASAWSTALHLALTSGLLVLVTLFGVLPAMLPDVDVRPAARLIARWQQEGRPIASLDKVRGEYDFAGRLLEPVVFLEPGQVPAWVAAHPGGVILTTDERQQADDPAPLAELNGGLHAWEVRALPERITKRHLR